jgi:hypothetical protein
MCSITLGRIPNKHFTILLKKQGIFKSGKPFNKQKKKN